ncbi:hypothetical protein QSJ18_15755 [Gordonia sp. ABSL1-1]|uniref:hypothetical protein n=1 Tax=Gordonia sp. ABSL1-1 TaxID=3053923 RepID=UPI0025727CBC|nr:hypothetical protein [Gordonia sp. ABSL1-1]MDL9938207.1 hypothetical protein [Gordonia sp. ABSL1-1]
MRTVFLRAPAMPALLCALVVAGCGTAATSDRSPSTSVTASPTAASPITAAGCVQTPPSGPVDRMGHDLAFTTGFIRIAVSPSAPQPALVPPPAPVPAPAPEPSPAPVPSAAEPTRCYDFTRWGPPNPAVPPDSLLFVFKGPGVDGAQLEFLVGELTGGALPPIGRPRPRVGPLTAPINAQVGISVAGTYHHSTACRLTLTAMSAERAAGHFICDAAVESDANPLGPQDDTPYDADDESATPTPAVPAPPGAPTPAPEAQAPTVTLSGWFDLEA